MKTIGRNDPCHCGSGRKYKRCCLPKDEARLQHARALGLQGGPRNPPAAETWRRGLS